MLDPAGPWLPVVEALGVWEWVQVAPPATTSFFHAPQNHDLFVSVEEIILGGLWFRPPPSA
jgi:hypothetical protein